MTPPDDLSFTDPAVWLSDRAVTVPVRGTSMVPFLEEGDRVEVVLEQGVIPIELQDRSHGVRVAAPVSGARSLRAIWSTATINPAASHKYGSSRNRPSVCEPRRTIAATSARPIAAVLSSGGACASTSRT